METPSRKVGASALAGALSIILVWLVGDVGDVEIPPAVASAITVVLTFAVGYFVSEA